MKHYEKHLVKSQMYMQNANYVKSRAHYVRAKELHPVPGFGAPWSSLTSWICKKSEQLMDDKRCTECLKKHNCPNDETMEEKLLEYKTHIHKLESELNRLYGENDKREHEEIIDDNSNHISILKNKSGKAAENFPKIMDEDETDPQTILVVMKNHVNERFEMLDELIKYHITKGNRIDVQIDRNMGNEIAKYFWRTMGAEDLHAEFHAHLKTKMDTFCKKHKGCNEEEGVVLLKKGGDVKNWVDFNSASPTSIRVWGANFLNHDQNSAFVYSGWAGQAKGIADAQDSLKKSLDGLFSIITVPFTGTAMPIPKSYPFWWPEELKYLASIS